jgi:NADPH:quinone reductase-like Zn-dependent oxidoreductase
MDDTMKCAMIHEYGPAAEVLRIQSVPVPSLRRGEVLVRQHATSVNPIDCRVRGGYGRVILSRMRGFELPLIPGRDVSGEVVKIGLGVQGLSVGDAVFGVSSTKANGAYAEYVVVKATEVVCKPVSLSFEAAAAFPYVACTRLGMRRLVFVVGSSTWTPSW